MSLKIMVVDHEPLSLKLIRSLAVPLGHTVLTFDDSEEAAQRAETKRFDVAFVDMSTPHSGGLELAHRIQNSPPNRETTIVMLSATNDVEMLRNAFGAGVQFVLPRPVTAARVIPMLTAMASPGWKVRIHRFRLPLSTNVRCKCGHRVLSMRSVNISETGILLQPSVDIQVGQEVQLEFEIAEVRTSLNVRARVVRVEGPERAGMEFIALAPEEQNAIQLYVMGRLRHLTPRQDLPDVRMHRLFSR